MKVGDLIEVYRHIPRHESGIIPVGKIGRGIIVDIEKSDVGSEVTYIDECGDVTVVKINASVSGEQLTIKALE